MNPILLDIPEQFETERLLLRAPQNGDGAMVNEAIRESYEFLHEWMKWADHIPETEETEANARKHRANFLLRDTFTFYILDKLSGAFIGTCSLVRVDWQVRQFEIGYWIRQSASRQGFMSEAVDGVTQFAFKNLQANRIEIRCDTRNSASCRVAERCGYHLEAILINNFIDPAGDLRDDCLYAKVRLKNGSFGYPTLISKMSK
ncbi:GNAT family N-acetyltransferase [Pseudalkalibacillus salsuginis]|uniref:GNAT family N-acetyltransferase n=1 Tax=Pseudalkalibacillus salsuginis TaxID=2910972 RepID=UPI001F28B152|nr:GNAT family N-acetyltransferase [Pseudalkalibacillus salsuginis]MCF6410018.1 GNAT family N-acetyltransferase [Pseudalkalibacillus salsuginis]